MSRVQHSYSSLSTFDTCPEQYRQIYLLRAYRKTFAKQQDGIDDHKLLEHRLRYQQPLPAPLAKAEPLAASLERSGKPEVELSLAVNQHLQPVGFWDGYLRGKYDVVLRWPEQRRAFIGDWKSGKVRETDEQLEIGALLLLQNDARIDIVQGVNIWLQLPKLGQPYTFRREEKDALWVKWLRRMGTIEKLDPGQEWEKRESGLCGYCPVKVCQHYRGG